MIAINLRDKKEYSCKEVENQYIPILNTAEYMIEHQGHIILLKKVRITKENIPQGYEYIHY